MRKIYWALAFIFVLTSILIILIASSNLFRENADEKEILSKEELLSNSPSAQDFAEEYGQDLDIKWDIEEETPSRISGSGVSVSKFTSEKVTEQNIDSVAREFRENNKELFKIEQEKIVETKKYSRENFQVITYQQTYSNLPVFGSYVTIAVKNDKIVLYKSLYEQGIDASTTKGISIEMAEKLAKGLYGFKGEVEKSSEIIYPKENDKYVLVYQIDLPTIKNRPNEENQNPYIAPRVFVDASNGQVIAVEDRIVYEDLTGTVTGMIHPVFGTDQEVELPLNHEWIYANSLQDETNENGQYSISGLSGNVNVQANLNGLWADVYNVQQERAEHGASVSVPSTHNWNWDNEDQSYKNEEENAFYHTNIIHDYITKPSLGVDEMNLQMEVNVNLPQSCNAYYDGVSINFFQPDGVSCESSALSSGVIYHEYGHGIFYALYPSYTYNAEVGNMNEGIADYWACTILNSPCQGTLWYSNECVRRCDTLERFPEDFYAEVHSGADIIASSFYGVREIYGADLVDLLVIDAYRLGPTSVSELLENSLIADDDNGDLTDGTPHIDDICHSFFDNHGIFSGHCIGHINNPVAFVNSPKHYAENIAGGESVIEIIGSAYGAPNEPLTSYVIEHRPYNDPNGWSSAGVTLTGGEVIEGTLGQINAAFLNPGLNLIRLTVFYGENKQVSFIPIPMGVISGEDLKPGWPINTGFDVLSSPSIVDLDGNGFKDVVMGSFSQIYALNYDGTFLQGWEGVGTSTSFSKPAIEDVDGDGFFEVFVTSTSEIAAWNHDGTTLEGWPKDLEFSEYASPTIADLDNDGDYEIIVTSWEEGKIYVWHHNGEILDGWPVNYEYSDWATPPSPAIGDLNNDGYKELIMGFTDGTVYAWHYDGSLVDGWPVTMPPLEISDFIFTSPPAVADFNQDGNIEIVIYSQFANRVYMLDSQGTLLEGWPVELDQYIAYAYYGFQSSPSIGDVDNNGDLEIFLGHGDGKVYGFNHDGTILEGWPKIVITNPGGYSAIPSSPALADVDNDGDLEIFIGAWDGTLQGFHHDGTLVEGFPKSTIKYIQSSPAVGDLEGDGKTDIIVGSFDNHIYAWEIDSPLGQENDGWSSLHHNNKNTKNYLEPNCGNSNIEQGEQCDDGNTISCDGCSSACHIETTEPMCGNNLVECGEFCDGNSASCVHSSGYAGIKECNEQCGFGDCMATEYCGDGLLNGPEECDGNFGSCSFGEFCNQPTCQCINVLGIDVSGSILTTNAMLNEENDIQAKIENGGSEDAGDVTATLYEVEYIWNGTDLEENLTLIDSVAVGNLAAGAETNINFSWTPTEFGYQNVKLVIDAPGDVVPENNEINSYINVVVNAPDVTGYIQTSQAIVNEENDIEINVKNIGSQEATGVSAMFYTNDGYWNGTDNVDNLTFIDSIDVGNLAAGAETNINFSWTPTEIGYQNVKLVIDAPGDGNLENNVGYNNINVIVNGPDVTGYIQTSQAIVNEENNIQATIQNIGKQTANSITATLYKNDDYWNGTDNVDNLTLIDSIDIGTINANENQEVSFTWIPTELGYQNVKMVIDAPGDGNLENNVGYSNINVIVNGPDVTGYIQTSQAFVNEENDIEINVNNIGSQEATGVTAMFYTNDEYWNGTDNVDNLTFIDSVDVGNLAAGAQTNVVFQWMPIELGYQNVKMIINAPGDGDLDNNEDYDWINVIVNAPDVTGYINVDSFVVEPNQDVSVSLSVYNGGGQTAENVIVRLYDIFDSTSTLIYETEIDSLSPLDGTEFNVIWNSGNVGEHVLQLNLSLEDDYDQSNNLHEKSVLVASLSEVVYSANSVPEYIPLVAYGYSGEIEEAFEIDGSVILDLPDLPIDIGTVYLQGGVDEEFFGIIFSDSVLETEMSTVGKIMETTQEISGLTLYGTYVIVPDWEYENSYIYLVENLTEIGAENEDDLNFYVCSDWDLTNDNCQSSWTEITEFDAIEQEEGYILIITEVEGSVEAFALGTGSIIGANCGCPADLNNDGTVDSADLAQLLGAWGENPGHPADFTGDGVVDSADLAQLLGAWGACPTTETSCSDSCDNDNDNLVDCADVLDCQAGASCENGGTCISGACVVCGDSVCSAGENCPADASGCTDNTCYEPTCTNGCGEVLVTNGSTDESCLTPNSCNGAGGCVAPPPQSFCGDGIVEGPEECDSNNFPPGGTPCTTYNSTLYDDGLLICNNDDCTVNTAQCNPVGVTFITACGQSIHQEFQTYRLQNDLVATWATGATCLVVDVNNIVIDGNGHKIIQDSSVDGIGGDGINIQNRNNVTVKNVSITSFGAGIGISLSSNITILNSNMTMNYPINAGVNPSAGGVGISSSTNVVLIGNYITSNNIGIKGNYGTETVTVHNNTICYNSGWGDFNCPVDYTVPFVGSGNKYTFPPNALYDCNLNGLINSQSC